MPTNGTPATLPAPTVVSSQPAEDAINAANQNVLNFNSNNPVPTGNPPTTPSTPTGTAPNPTPPQTFYSYTDPTSGVSSYYDQNMNEVDASAIKGGQATPIGNNPLQPGAPTTGAGTIPGTGTPAATALGTPGTVAGLNAQIASSNANIAQAGQNAINYLNAWQTGTISFTPAQSSLISSMTQNMNALIGLQTQANASYVGSATEAAARGGEYNPVNESAMIHQAVFTANLQLGALQSQQAQAIAQAQISFQNQDFTNMLDANDAYMKAQEQVQSTLENLASTIQKSIVDTQTFNEKLYQDTFTNKMAQAGLSLQQRQEAFNEYIGQANLTLSQKMDAQQILDEQNANAIAAAQLALSQATFQAEWGGGSAGGNFASVLGGGLSGGGSGTSPSGGAPTNGANQPAVPTNSDGSAPTGSITYNPGKGGFYDTNGNQVTGSALSALMTGMNAAGIHTYGDGLAYFDPSGYSNQDQATGMGNVARGHGIPVLAPADASIVNSLEAAKTEVTTMQTYFAAAGNPSNILTVPFADLKKGISALYGGETSQNATAYQASQSSLYAIMSSLSQSKRANGQEFDVGTVSTPNVSGFYSVQGEGPNTLIANGNAQFGALTKQLNALIASIVPGFQGPPDALSASPEDLLNFGSQGTIATPTANSSNPFASAYASP